MKVGIGQDSHRFDFENKLKKLVLGGVVFEKEPPMQANSDGDVILHAITNAISGITCKNILGEITDKMCKSGITDSREYLKKALEDLIIIGEKIQHISISIEAKTPKMTPKIPEMRKSIAEILSIKENQVGITATTGEGLTAFGKGEGIAVIVILTTGN